MPDRDYKYIAIYLNVVFLSLLLKKPVRQHLCGRMWLSQTTKFSLLVFKISRLF